jgi:hypothetical protein
VVEITYLGKKMVTWSPLTKGKYQSMLGVCCLYFYVVRRTLEENTAKRIGNTFLKIEATKHQKLKQQKKSKISILVN